MTRPRCKQAGSTAKTLACTAASAGKFRGRSSREVPDDSLCSLDHRLRGPCACPPQIQQPRGALHPRNLDRRTGTGAAAPVSGYAERGPGSQVEQNAPADLLQSVSARAEKKPRVLQEDPAGLGQRNSVQEGKHPMELRHEGAARARTRTRNAVQEGAKAPHMAPSRQHAGQR